MSTLTSCEPHKEYRFLIGVQIRHFIRCIPCLPNRLALWWLGRQFRKDSDYRDSWIANIAMPIYDATRMKCICNFNDGHEKWCPIVKAHEIRAFECGEMSHAHANYIAENLMKHLFKA